MIRRAGFALRTAPMFAWLVACAAAGLALCLLRRGRGDANRDFGRLFSRGILRLWGVELRVEGRETLAAHHPCVFVANHQSALDMATFGAIYPSRTVLIGKKELKWIPLFGWFFAAAGNIMIDRASRLRSVAGLGPAIEGLRAEGRSVWIFPEGTRGGGEGRELLPFKKGAFHMAIAAGVPVVPVVSAPLHGLVSWRERRLEGGTLRLRVLAPVPTAGLTAADIERLSGLVRARMQEALDELSGAKRPVRA